MAETALCNLIGSPDESLAAAERRDPLGHTIHVLCAIAFLLALPHGTAPANILSAPLVLITILRWRSVGPIILSLRHWSPVPWAIALVAWAALSLAWSADREHGLHLLASLRIFFLPACLAPLLGYRALLGAALLASITVQALIQCGEYAINRAAWNFDGLSRFGGFTSDPGKAGLWSALGVIGAAALALTQRGAIRWLSLALTFVCAGGVVASGSRRQLLALGVALPVLLLLVLLVAPERRKRVIVLVLLVFALGAAAWPIAGPSIKARWSQTWEQLDRAPSGSGNASALDQGARAAPPPPVAGIVHYDLRAYYWRAVIDAWRAHPIRGLGLGSSGAAIASSANRPAVEAWLRGELAREYRDRSTEENETELAKRLDADHPHSTWMQLLVETGMIGALLGLTALVGACLSALRAARAGGARDPLAIAATAALLLWGIGAIFDASINATSLGAVVVVAVLGARLTDPSGSSPRPSRLRS